LKRRQAAGECCYGFSPNSDNGTCISYMNRCHGVTVGLVMWHAQHLFMTRREDQSYVS
jgi:hypothetical protein